MRAIDADALINELNNSHYPGAPYVDAGISIAIGKVLDAPTIDPERKKGKWISQDLNKHSGMISTAVYYYPKCRCVEAMQIIRISARTAARRWRKNNEHDPCIHHRPVCRGVIRDGDHRTAHRQ